jgi:DmsE family decaheme c-type cytochrome
MPDRRERARWWAVVAGMLAAVLLASPGSAPRAAEDCATCHSDVAAAFPGLPHGRAFKFDRNYGSATCESCHGPGQAHVEGEGDKTKILHPRRGEAARVNEACLSCHENGDGHGWWQGSAHEASGVRCAECHTVHAAAPARKSPIAVNRSTEICLSCHTALRKGLTQRSRHPLSEGKMDCVSCHNPHGSASEAALKADSVNDLCYSCHQEKRGPFLWEHAPVRESCATCHAPHGSNHDKLLVSRTVQLCQSCHLQGRHQTVAGVPEAYWNQNRQCLNCHPQIHGSNHLSGPLFQR